MPTIEALSEAHIPEILNACWDWEELAQYGAPYWRPRSAAELRRRINLTAGPQPSSDYTFVLRDGEDLVAECSVHAIDWRNRVAHVGVCVWNPAHRRRGYGVTATQAVIDWATGYLGLRRLEAWVNADNLASLRLFTRLGFVNEGILRERYFFNGKRCDVHILGLLTENT
ncbi:GNAT family protein [Raineyella sp. W15-4]|uniref:GNAT family N-acetyltransferase n=1 Tax=Raineyella sp. W15-4 TaxID=3081651 RepID=UPI0029551D5A|nr:GNAT family protein [Raineyella sp. W15-4]WOQ17589.1 GNAT family protein [Raineyella sp. W15-4]